MWHCTEQYQHFETKCWLPTQFAGRRINTSHSVVTPLLCPTITTYSLSFCTHLKHSGFLGNSEKRIFCIKIRKWKFFLEQLLLSWCTQKRDKWNFFFFFFHWLYSPLWDLDHRAISFHFFLSVTMSLHRLTPRTLRSLPTSSFHPFLGLPLRLGPSSSWVKILLGIISSPIISRWPNQLILCPFIHFTVR